MISVNQTYFNTIDTEQKAYWLGYMFADGYSAVKAPWTVVVQTIDIDHLKLLADDIEYGGTLKYPKTPSGFGSKTQSARLVVCRKKMCVALNDLGKNNLTLPKLNPELSRHFLRGMFDGDGSFTFKADNYTTKNGVRYGPYAKAGWSIILHKRHLRFFEDALSELGVNYHIANSKTEYMKYIKVSSWNAIQKIYNYMYLDSTRSLDRKRNKMESAINYYVSTK